MFILGPCFLLLSAHLILKANISHCYSLGILKSCLFLITKIIKLLQTMSTMISYTYQLFSNIIKKLPHHLLSSFLLSGMFLTESQTTDNISFILSVHFFKSMGIFLHNCNSALLTPNVTNTAIS